MTDLVGTCIGPYQIIAKLGRGGMADVYKAWHQELEMHRAIKFVRPEFVTSEDFRARFQKEAQAVARLRHPNIVQVHDFGIDDGHYYMVMEFLEGTTLKASLVRDGRVDIRRAVDIVKAVASALQYAHERDLIHRDIKPDNIMLAADDKPVLMDFGIAKLLNANTEITQTGTGIGTPAYMAPEQAKGLTISPATDIYALGIVLFEMLTGRAPYSADTPIAVLLKAISDPMPMPRSINPEISEALQGVILKSTAKDPLARYQSAGAFTTALEQAMQQVPPNDSAQQATTRNDTPRRTRDMRRWLTLGGVLLAGVSGYLVLNDRGDPAPADISPPPPVTATTQTPAAALNETPDMVEQSVSTSASTTIMPPPGSSTDPVIYTVDTMLEPGQAIKQTLSLTKGETVFLNFLDTSLLTDVVLKTPGNRAEVFNLYRDGGPFVIRQTGEHTLTIQIREPTGGHIAAELVRLVEPVRDGGSIESGVTFSGVTEWPGQTVMHHVDLPADATVYFNVMRSATTADFTLTAPDKRTVVFSNYRDSGPIKVRAAGVYTLIIDPRDDTLADFDAALFVLKPPQIDQGESRPGDIYTDRTTIPGQFIIRRYQFAPGDHVFLDVIRSANTTDFTLLAPDGRTRLIESYRTDGPHVVRQAGTHTLIIDPRDAALADNDLSLVLVSPPEVDGGVIQPGTTIRGGNELPGQLIVYRVNLKANSTVQFAASESTVTFDFRLMRPDRRLQPLFDTYSTAAGVVVHDAGTYELIADPRDAGVGTFVFRLDSRTE